MRSPSVGSPEPLSAQGLGGCTMRYIQRLFIPSSGNRELFPYSMLDCGFTYSSWRFLLLGALSVDPVHGSCCDPWLLLHVVQVLNGPQILGCSKSSLYYRVLGLKRPGSQLSFLAFGILGSFLLSDYSLKARCLQLLRLSLYTSAPQHSQSRRLLLSSLLPAQPTPLGKVSRNGPVRPLSR